MRNVKLRLKKKSLEFRNLIKTKINMRNVKFKLNKRSLEFKHLIKTDINTYRLQSQGLHRQLNTRNLFNNFTPFKTFPSRQYSPEIAAF